jgi:hypothetical protein
VDQGCVPIYAHAPQRFALVGFSLIGRRKKYTLFDRQRFLKDAQAEV